TACRRRGRAAAIASISISSETSVTADLPSNDVGREPRLIARHLKFYFRTCQAAMGPAHGRVNENSREHQTSDSSGEQISVYNAGSRTYQLGTKIELMGVEMTKSRGVAILVGAGDAIGAAVARRFAQGGYAVCICRREAAKSQALV